MGATFTQRARSLRRQRPFPTNRPSNLRDAPTFAQNMSAFLTVWQEAGTERRPEEGRRSRAGCNRSRVAGDRRFPQEKKARAGQVTGAGPAQRPLLRRSSSVDWWSRGESNSAKQAFDLRKLAVIGYLLARAYFHLTLTTYRVYRIISPVRRQRDKKGGAMSVTVRIWRFSVTLALRVRLLR